MTTREIPRVALIMTGSELLLGRVIDTNSAWLGLKLAEMGWTVASKVTVPDGRSIGRALERVLEDHREEALSGVVICGGLGPTSDDLTRDEVARVTGLGLEHSAEAEAVVRRWFERSRREMPEVNLRQAMVVKGAEVLDNPEGTAPGLRIPADAERGHPEIFLLPGPPRELKPMVEQRVLPVLAAKSGRVDRAVREIRTVGIGESRVQELVDADLGCIAGLDEVGYCARPGEVDIRLTGTKAGIEAGQMVVCAKLGLAVVNSNGLSLAGTLVEMLAARGLSVATAESCTGGLIAKLLTDVPGASRVLGYGWVTYANAAKQTQLGVPGRELEEHGAVSREVARSMALGALQRSGADLALAVTGIAGPDGGTPEKPAGTVYIALASRRDLTGLAGYPEPAALEGCEPGCLVWKEFFPVAREAFRSRVANFALKQALDAARMAR